MKTIALSLLPALMLLLIIGCSKESDPTKPKDDEIPTNTWTTESLSVQGEYPSLAVNSEGIPCVSYLDFNDDYIKYAVRNGNSWTIESVGKVSNANGTVANGGISSLAMDPAGNPRITYYDYGNVHFKYARKIGDGWDLAVIPLPNDPLMSYASPFIPWEESSIVIDQSGTAHVSLQMTGGLSGNVTGYWRSGYSTAVIVDVADANCGYHNAIALDGNGNPGISYEARTSGELKYAHWNGVSFDLETISPMPLFYWRERLTTLRYDNANSPHIVTYGQTNYKYLHKSGGVWISKDIPFQSGYPAISLDLDANGSPRIALVTVDTGNSYRLKYAYLNGDNWVFENIADDIEISSLVVDQAGKIHILFETDFNELKYAHN